MVVKLSERATWLLWVVHQHTKRDWATLERFV